MFLFSICGLSSGLLNGNALPLTLLGVFDYIKNFLVIFIYAAFFRDFDEFKKLFRILLFIAFLIGVIALIQFLWAMGSVYIFEKNIMDPDIYIFFEIPEKETFKAIFWRLGVFRASSITYHPYILGLFSLLILIIYCYTKKRTSLITLFPILSGVITSFSRIVFGGLVFVLLLQFVKKYKVITPLILVISLLIMNQLNYTSNINLTGMFDEYMPADEEIIDPNEIRKYTRYKSIEIWKDHPFWGVGPGMFGGVIASKYSSHIFEEYNVKNLAYINRIGGIEQFWFQIMAETGIIGTFAFIGLIVSLFVILSKLKAQTDNKELKGLLSALRIFIGCILIYSIGSGINIAPVLFTYCAIVGIALGSVNNIISSAN